MDRFVIVWLIAFPFMSAYSAHAQRINYGPTSVLNSAGAASATPPQSTGIIPIEVNLCEGVHQPDLVRIYESYIDLARQVYSRAKVPGNGETTISQENFHKIANLYRNVNNRGVNVINQLSLSPQIQVWPALLTFQRYFDIQSRLLECRIMADTVLRETREMVTTESSIGRSEGSEGKSQEPATTRRQPTPGSIARGTLDECKTQQKITDYDLDQMIARKPKSHYLDLLKLHYWIDAFTRVKKASSVNSIGGEQPLEISNYGLNANDFRLINISTWLRKFEVPYISQSELSTHSPTQSKPSSQNETAWGQPSNSSRERKSGGLFGGLFGSASDNVNESKSENPEEQYIKRKAELCRQRLDLYNRLLRDFPQSVETQQQQQQQQQQQPSTSTAPAPSDK